MDILSSAIRTLSSGLSGQARRMEINSENVANVDTPGYRRKLAIRESESQTFDGPETSLHRVIFDKTELPKIHDPGHPMADATGNYFGSNVDISIEIADAIEASRNYQANLKLFSQTRDMSSNLMKLLRE